MKPYELTDEQITGAYYSKGSLHLPDYGEMRKAVACAAQKKLLEYQNGKCEHFPNLKMRRWDCGKCWQSLLKDFGIK